MSTLRQRGRKRAGPGAAGRTCRVERRTVSPQALRHPPGRECRPFHAAQRLGARPIIGSPGWPLAQRSKFIQPLLGERPATEVDPREDIAGLRQKPGLLPIPTNGRVCGWRPGSMSPSKTSVSGVFRGESRYVLGTDSRPLFTSRRAKPQSLASSSVASRKARLASLLGVMKSVLRVELRMSHPPRRHARCCRCRAACLERRLATPGEVSRPGCRRPEHRCSHHGPRTARRHARYRLQTARGHAGMSPCAGKRSVDADPFQVEPGFASEQGLNPRDDAIGLPFGHRVGIPAELEVDAPTLSGCRCSSTDWFG